MIAGLCNTEASEDDLMFEETEKVAAEPNFLDNKVEVSLKLRMGHKLELYIQSPRMHLRRNGKKFLDPLERWEQMKAWKYVTVVYKLWKTFLACPTISAPLQRVWSQSSWVVTSATACQLANVTSATMFLGGNKEILQTHYSDIVNDIYNSVPLYIPVAEKAEELNVDI